MTPEQRQRLVKAMTEQGYGKQEIDNVLAIKEWQAAQNEWKLSQKGRRDPEQELLDQRRRALVAGRADADGVKRGLNLSQIPENGGRLQALNQRLKSLTGPMYPDGRMTRSDISGGPGLLRDSPAPRDIPRPQFRNSIPSGGHRQKDGRVTTPESFRLQPISLTGGLNRLGSETGLAPQAQPNLSNTPVAPPVDNEFAYIEDGLELPSGVLKALMMAESGGDVNARSSKGALGAFQLMPKTAEDHGANPFNLHEAAMAAGNELKWQLRSHKGDLDKALASYNYGHGNVRKRGSNLQAIDKYQRKQTGRSETTEHRERFHQYFDKPVQPPMQPLQQDVQVPQKGISAMPKPSFIPKGISAMPKPDAAYRQSQQQPMQSLSAQDLFNRQFQQDVQPPPPLQLGRPTGYRTTEGRLAFENNFGGMSTEYSMGVRNPQINNGQLTHIPSIWGGKVRDQKYAEDMIIKNQGIDPETGRYVTPGGNPEERSKGLELMELGVEGVYSPQQMAEMVVHSQGLARKQGLGLGNQ